MGKLSADPIRTQVAAVSCGFHQDTAVLDLDYLEDSTAGSDGNFVRHNRIEHMPHHAINLSENPNGRNIVEYNEIRYSEEEIADSAAIKSSTST